MRRLLTLVLIATAIITALSQCEPVEGNFDDEPLPDDPMEEPLENGA